MSYRFGRGRAGTRAVITGCLATVLLITAACSSSGSKSGTTGGSTSSGASATSGTSNSGVAAAKADVAKFSAAATSYATITPVSGASGLKGKSVWYIPIGSASAILTAIGAQMKVALGHLGVTVRTCDGKFIPTNQSACMSEAISQKADAVVTSFIDYASIPTSFNNLTAHHIPVLIAGEAPDGGKKTSTPALGFYDLTQTLVRQSQLNMAAAIADSNGKAKILYLGVNDSAPLLAATAAGKAYVKKNCPSCTFTDLEYASSNLNKVPSQISAALISHSDTNYVLIQSDTAASGAISGIQTAGFTQKVKVSSEDGDLDALQRVKSGGVQFADIGSSGIYNGWQFADGIVRQLLGKAPISGLGVLRVFTKENVSTLNLTPSAYVTNAWYGTNAYQKTFLSAWGVS